jgi:hypothetical protein
MPRMRKLKRDRMKLRKKGKSALSPVWLPLGALWSELCFFSAPRETSTGGSRRGTFWGGCPKGHTPWGKLSGNKFKCPLLWRAVLDSSVLVAMKNLLPTFILHSRCAPQVHVLFQGCLWTFRVRCLLLLWPSPSPPTCVICALCEISESPPNITDS